MMQVKAPWVRVREEWENEKVRLEKILDRLTPNLKWDVTQPRFENTYAVIFPDFQCNVYFRLLQSHSESQHIHAYHIVHFEQWISADGEDRKHIAQSVASWVLQDIVEYLKGNKK